MCYATESTEILAFFLKGLSDPRGYEDFLLTLFVTPVMEKTSRKEENRVK